MSKIGVGRGLCQVSIKNLLAQIILEKTFGTKWSNPVKLDRKRKVWCLFRLNRYVIDVACKKCLKSRESCKC